MTAVLLLAVLFYQPGIMLAAPITTVESGIQSANGNITILSSEAAPTWATTSNVRSTGNLLWSCLLTWFICVYTVNHINIPAPGERSRQFYFRKTKWALTAIFAPEFALAAAYQQWAVARNLKNILNEFNPKPSAEKTPTKVQRTNPLTWARS